MSQNSIRGTIKVSLAGGPLDGAHYRDLPDPGKPTSGVRLSIPLTQPAEASIHAVYVCTQPGTASDVWKFRFVKTVFPQFPTGTQVTFK